MNLPVYVIGHKIPDTDSICGALALAELKTENGSECNGRKNWSSESRNKVYFR